MSILNHILHLRCLTSFLPIPTIQQQFLKNSSQLVTILNMNEAILLHEKGSKNFKMSFRYINPELNVNRQFNFERHVDESINNFVQRINKNINVHLKEKSYRRLKKQDKYVTPVKSIKSDIEDNVKFLRNDSVLNGDLTCQTILNNSSDIKLVIFDKEYILKQNIPSITKLELPSSILINFPVYPSKFEGKNVDKSKSSFNWYKNEKNKWIHVGEGFSYVPSSFDLGCRLKISCIPKNNVESGLLTEIASNNVVEIGPDLCLFNTRHAFTKDKLSGKR